MADNLTDTYENAVLDWLNPDVSAPTRPTTPLTVALLTAAGSDSAAGTEAANSGGSTYARQNVTLAAAASGATSNTNLISFANMPASTIVAIAIYENGGGRIWHGPLAANKTVNLGDTFQIAIGDLDLSIG